MEASELKLIIDEAIHPEEHAGPRMTHATQWKGTLVPMNDHSDKDAVLYTCPETGKDYRFILHRKNHQKADNYACARCKSRKKYVRILIAGEYFLEDPAKLDHICYLGPEELRIAREILDKQKNLELLKERRIRVKKDQIRPKVGDQMLDLARIQHETAAYPFNAIASLFEENVSHQQPELRMTSPTVSGDEDAEVEQIPGPSSSILDSVFNNTIKVEQEEHESDVRKEMELQKSDPEPKEPLIKRPRTSSFGSPHAERDDASFYISLNRALSGLKPDSRPRAENEILRFVYSKLYEKYGL